MFLLNAFKIKDVRYKKSDSTGENLSILLCVKECFSKKHQNEKCGMCICLLK